MSDSTLSLSALSKDGSFTQHNVRAREKLLRFLKLTKKKPCFIPLISRRWLVTKGTLIVETPGSLPGGQLLGSFLT